MKAAVVEAALWMTTKEMIMIMLLMILMVMVKAVWDSDGVECDRNSKGDADNDKGLIMLMSK